MSASNCPETPRQKMIGMMYLVYTALLALNVSVNVLDGFNMVDQSLVGTIKSNQVKNEYLYDKFDYLADQNPEKVGKWLEKSKQFKDESTNLYNYIQDLKMSIAKTADGDNYVGDEIFINGGIVDGVEYLPEHIGARDNLDVAAQLTLPDTGTRGKELHEMIDNYRNLAIEMMPDTTKHAALRTNFNTDPRKQNDGSETPWEYGVFHGMPVCAAVTILSKLQTDILSAESEVVDYLIKQVDASDFRVNKIDALVIPESNYVIKGGTFNADIVLAAMDSTAKPEVFIGGKEIPNGKYSVACNSVGTFNITGELKMKNPAGEVISYPVKSSYIVGEPSVTISADMMNVFYAGIVNPISVSVPGIPSSSLQVTMTNGTINRTATGWSVKPAKVGQECKIMVSATMDNGKTQSMGFRSFRVKALPPPIAFIATKGANGLTQKYKGGTGIAKATLLAAAGVRAELDDEDLDVKYNVLSFETNFFDSMGNTLVEPSQGDKFSSKQMDSMKKLVKGKKFFISKIRAKGPDGIERILPPIEVIIN